MEFGGRLGMFFMPNIAMSRYEYGFFHHRILKALITSNKENQVPLFIISALFMTLFKSHSGAVILG